MGVDLGWRIGPVDVFHCDQINMCLRNCKIEIAKNANIICSVYWPGTLRNRSNAKSSTHFQPLLQIWSFLTNSYIRSVTMLRWPLHFNVPVESFFYSPAIYMYPANQISSFSRERERERKERGFPIIFHLISLMKVVFICCQSSFICYLLN